MPLADRELTVYWKVPEDRELKADASDDQDKQ